MGRKLFQRQLDAGAWAITVANMAQAAVADGAGAQRVLVADEIVSQADARAVVQAVEDEASPAERRRELYCLVDSVEGVELLDRNLSGPAWPPKRLESSSSSAFRGGRTGARSQDEGVAVAGAVGASAWLRLVGVEGYEGLLAPDRSAGSLAKVDRYLDGLRRLNQAFS